MQPTARTARRLSACAIALCAAGCASTSGKDATTFTYAEARERQLAAMSEEYADMPGGRAGIERMLTATAKRGDVCASNDCGRPVTVTGHATPTPERCAAIDNRLARLEKRAAGERLVDFRVTASSTYRLDDEQRKQTPPFFFATLCETNVGEIRMPGGFMEKDTVSGATSMPMPCLSGHAYRARVRTRDGEAWVMTHEDIVDVTQRVDRSCKGGEQ